MQIQHVKNRELGFDKNNLIEIDMQHSVQASFPVIKQDLLRTGLIQNAALANHVILYGGDNDDRFNWPGKAPSNDINICFRKVSPEFVATYGMHVAEGRDFTANALAEKSNIIINKSLERLMGSGSAVGKTIQSPRDQNDGVLENLTVTGVVDDFVFGDMAEEHPQPVILFCRQPDWENLVYVRLKQNANASDALAKIEGVMKKDNPAYPLQYRFTDDQFNETFVNEALMSKIAGVFAVLAIIISCLGLFGLAAYTAERRLKEIGIRKVLGAGVAGLAALLSADFLKLVGISCLASFPIAGWIMHGWLQNYSYRITMSWWIFLAAGVIAMLIALVTISFQTVRAAVANPVKSLRSE